VPAWSLAAGGAVDSVDVPDGRSGNATIPTTSAAAETNPPTIKSVRCSDGGRPGCLTFRRVRRSGWRVPATCLSGGSAGAGSGCLVCCRGRRSGWPGPISAKSREGDGGSSGCAVLCRGRLSGWPGPTPCLSGAGRSAGAGAGADAGAGGGAGATGAAEAAAGASGGAGGGGVAGAGAGGVVTCAVFCRGRRSGWLAKTSGGWGVHCSCAAGPVCSVSSWACRRGRPRQRPFVVGRRSRRPCALLFLGIGSGMLGSG
jgi:hypothetical protein